MVQSHKSNRGNPAYKQDLAHFKYLEMSNPGSPLRRPFHA